jgi:N utilization substance protein B
VCERGPALDELIADRAKNWRLSRMAAVDRNVLRLGTYELFHSDTPAAVVIDEAVELARRFGSDTSPAFVNGILDALAEGLREAHA